LEKKLIFQKLIFQLDSICPSGPVTITVMKLKFLDQTQRRGQELIARFGHASLVKLSDGQWRLQGGTEEDRHTAREWISLFMHEAVVPRE
jgi:hypothetical protein